MKNNIFVLSTVIALFAGSSNGIADQVTDGGLRVELNNAYNFVVDSNVESTSTYAPRSAYLSATFYNDGSSTLTNVFVHIGNHADGTPGIYPHRPHMELLGLLTGAGYDSRGDFALTHEGGSSGLTDASRFLGNIQPGERKTVYWLVSYPNLDAAGRAVWGPSVKPDDDLWLEYDVWADAMEEDQPRDVFTRRRVTMRNEISASANKILPNTANKVPQEYQDLLGKYAPEWKTEGQDGSPGTRLVAEGIWYDLGNVGQGFDNDGDLIPDYNAWMQPVGDPSLFDPGAFQLVRTRAFIVVKLKSGGELVITAEDNLYFENIPENTGVIGWVGYEFLPMISGITSILSPYQEVASGFDNEKFNGDYGATLGIPFTIPDPLIAMEKTVDLPLAFPGDTLTYTITFTNNGAFALGDPEEGFPVTIRDAVPVSDGARYIGGSAESGNLLPAGVSSYTVLYSTNNMLSWLNSEPLAAADVTHIQWWLSDPFPTNSFGSVGFKVRIDTPYMQTDPLIYNLAALGFGNAAPTLEDDATTLLLGTNQLGDTVFYDTGDGFNFGNASQDAGEPGISNMTVSLYYDSNSNGNIDASDVYIGETETDASGKYRFTNLPDGFFIVEVDIQDNDLPAGYTVTTPILYSADLDSEGLNSNPVIDNNADFGFAPALTLDKNIVGTNVRYEGDSVTFTVDLGNKLPGDGIGGVYFPTLTTWASSVDSANSGASSQKQWDNPTFATGASGPDGSGASAPFKGAREILAVTGFDSTILPGSPTGVVVVVNYTTIGTYASDDSLTYRVIDAANPANVYGTATVTMDTLTSGELLLDVSAERVWAWSDFTNSAYSIQLLTAGQDKENATLYVDAVGFRLTGDQSSADVTENTILQPVPLYDRFDSNRLEFVSASPAETSVSYINGTGTLFWADIGPVYPGGTNRVEVTFNVLEPYNNQQGVTTNTAFTLNAEFGNGLSANDAIDEADVTINPTGSIGDFIWRDLNGDGIQDGGTETGIAGVSVVLTPPPGVDAGNGVNVPVTNSTDSSGYYLFDSLPESGLYTVAVLTSTLPGGGLNSTNTYDENNGIAGGVDGDPDNQTQVNLLHDDPNGNDNHLTADFGYIVPTLIDGLVWNDLNNSADSTHDTGEPWLYPVTVYLFDDTGDPSDISTAIATNQTDSSGYFQFTGSYSGDYTILVDTNSGPLAVGSWSQTFDSDGVFSPNQAEVSVVTGGSAHVDYSYIQTGLFSIGDTLFYDWDGDAIRDASDEPIANLPLLLYLDNNTNGLYDQGIDGFIRSDTSDADGEYLFSNLPSNSYVVVVDTASSNYPSGYIQTLDPDESGVASIGDDQGSAVITVADRLDIDFAYQPVGNGSIGDTVWRDINGDMIQAGPLETGISNITVTLYADLNNDGTFVFLETTSTDVNGKYLFDNLPAGNYRVVVDNLDGDLPSDSYLNLWLPTTPVSDAVSLSSGDLYRDADFGFTTAGAIGDTIFWDVNGNGTQDWNEEGISNVTVNLFIDSDNNGIYSAGDQPFASPLLTDADGYYYFSGLPADSYIVMVDTQSTAIAGITLTADPDADGLPSNTFPPGSTENDSQTDVTLVIGQRFMGADFGYNPPGSLGDAVWIDSNEDGVYDATEWGIPFVPVVLYTNGILVAETATDADGFYFFANLPDALYTVTVDTSHSNFPSLLSQTFDPDGTADDTASSVVMTNSLVISIGPNTFTEGNMNVDFGYNYSGVNVLSGTVGIDGASPDGVIGSGDSGYNPDETPFPGKTVYAYMWDDLNTNGIPDPGESTQVDTTTTDAQGDYIFSSLPATLGGSNEYYIVSISAPMPDLYLTTSTGDTPAQWVNSSTNVNGTSVSTYQVVTIQPTNTGIDFAYILSDNYDFGDLPDSYGTTLAANGARHALSITPALYLGAGVDSETDGQPSLNADGDGADEDGVIPLFNWYEGTNGGNIEISFSGSGYIVGWIDFNRSGDFTGPSEMVISQPVSGSGVITQRFDIATGALADTNNTLYARFRIFPDEPTFPVLAFTGNASDGEVEDYMWSYGVIGDRVWYDMNEDGVQDPAEWPIPDVTLFLDLNSDGSYNPGEPVQVTDSNGNYAFGALTGGTYQVVVDASTLPLGVTPTFDISAPYDGMANVSIADEEVRLDVDFGYKPFSTAVTITDFSAKLIDGKVTLFWETGSERGTLGFYLQRLGDNGYISVNKDILLSNPFSIGPRMYSTVDPEADPSSSLVYRLIEVEYTGKQIIYGPYSVSLEQPSITLSVWKQNVFSPEQLADPSVSGDLADPDGDGLCNAQEFVTGTDPLNPLSVLRLTAIRVSPGGVEVKWSSVADKFYSIRLHPASSGGYVILTTGIPATPPTNTFLISPEQMQSNSFIQVTTGE